MRKMGEPLHVTIYSELKSKILCGVLNPGDRLPSENEMAQQYDTSRMTVRKSLQRLENEDFIHAWQGKGYFISQPTRHTNFSFLFSEEEKGCEVIYRRIDAHFPSEKIQEALEISSSDLVIEIRRIIKRRGRPIALDLKYVPYTKGEPSLEAEMQYAVFPEIAAMKMAPFAFHTKMEISAEQPDEEVAEDLQCPKSTPLLVAYRYLIAHSGERVGYGAKYMLEDYGKIEARSGYEP